MQSIIKDTENRQADSVTEPITRAEAKAWCIIDHTDDDTLIDRLITTARMQVEKKTNLSLVEMDITITVDIKGSFRLPHGPIRTIVSIERRDGYTDDDPDWQTLTTDDYRIDGNDFKTISGLRCGIHRITYVAGFTDEDGDFPIEDGLKNAVSAQTAFLYENRGDNNSKGKFSDVAKILLSGYKDYSHV